MKFEILMVRAGWFVFRLDQAEVWTSRIWGLDSPGQLLRLLAEGLAGGEGSVVFPGEPERWTLTIRGGEAVVLALRRDDETLLHGEGIDLYSLACDVAEAFDRLDREAYGRAWMPFPAAELRALKLCLGDDSDFYQK